MQAVWAPVGASQDAVAATVSTLPVDALAYSAPVVMSMSHFQCNQCEATRKSVGGLLLHAKAVHGVVPGVTRHKARLVPNETLVRLREGGKR